jgi:SAM-dependent methyltransferase
LDLGCGEGKNAAAFASAGALVDAVDCSPQGIANGREVFAHSSINWFVADAVDYLKGARSYDIIIMYGLLHCLPSPKQIAETIDLAICRTTNSGRHFVVAFNDGPHDLSAHPDLSPTLLSHKFYLAQYAGHQILDAEFATIHETHAQIGLAFPISVVVPIIRKICWRFVTAHQRHLVQFGTP